MTESSDNLEAIRTRIDAIDEAIVRLVNERASQAAEIGRIKRSAGTATYVPDRERAVLDRVLAANQGPLPDRTLLAIYRELMSGSLTLERPPRIAYLGPPGSYSHLAARRKFGTSVDFEPVGHISNVFDEIERGRVDLGLVPVENTIGGGVIDTLDAFATRSVTVCAEVNLSVQHVLMAAGSLEDIETIYSKPEVFAQCQKWLSDTGMADKTVAVASTSKAAELAAADPATAAVASELAAEIYGLRIIRDHLEDDPGNVTRFLVIGRTSARPTGHDKTALLFMARDEPGSLVEVLDVIRQAGVNMTYIESRPSRQKQFEYCFFVDLEGHLDEPAMTDVIERMQQHCRSLKVLGSFPRSDEIV